MDLRLDPQTLEDIHRALCDAFPRIDLLGRFAKHKLGISPQELAGETNLQDLADKLLDAAESSGRLPLLLRQARRKNPGAEGLRKLERLLLPSFTTEELDVLSGLLPEPPPPARLERLAMASAPRDWLFPVPVKNERAAMALLRFVDSLSSAQVPASGSHPLHAFVDRLAEELPAARAGLQQWIRDTRGQPQPVPAAASARSLLLFVKCDSGLCDAVSPGTDLTVTAWLWRLGPGGEPLASIPERVIDEVSCKLGELPELLTRTRKQPRFAALLEEVQEEMTVEVCVREALLAEAVDNWNIGFGRSPTRLGHQYPVMLRSYERLYELRDVWGGWRAKWERLKALAPAPAESPVQWIGPDDAGEPLYELLMARETLCVASRQCCTPEHFQVSIDGGAPAVVWLRLKDVHPDEVYAFLQPLLTTGRLVELPRRIYAARSTRKKSELAKHITLVWDNYDRLPPDVEDDSTLSAPAVG